MPNLCRVCVGLRRHTVTRLDTDSDKMKKLPSYVSSDDESFYTRRKSIGLEASEQKKGKHGLIYYHVLEATVAQHQDSLLAVHNCYFLLVVALVH